MIYLGGQDDQEATEDVDKVQEEVNRVPNVVVVASVEALHDQLGVKQDEPTEQEQAKVQMKLCVCVCV